MVTQFPMNSVELSAGIEATVAKFDLYRSAQKGIQFQNKEKVLIPSKGIILEFVIYPNSGGSALSITAMSPICTISDDFEKEWTNHFLTDLYQVIAADKATSKAC